MGKDFRQLSVRISYQPCIYMRAEYGFILCSIFFLVAFQSNICIIIIEKILINERIDTMRKKLLKILLYACITVTSFTTSVSAESLPSDIFVVNDFGYVIKSIDKYYPEIGTTAYTVVNTNVRTAPNGTIKTTIPSGSAVQIQSYDGDWVNTDQGYIYAGLLSKTHTYQASIHADGNESLKYMGLLYDTLEKSPKAIKNLLNTTNITLIESQEKLAAESDTFPDNISGYTEYLGGTKTEIHIWANTTAMTTDIFHELGHAFDYSLDARDHCSFADTDEWLRYYDAEHQALQDATDTPEHNTSTPYEYFAESVQEYILEPEILQKNCPDTYDCLDKLLN